MDKIVEQYCEKMEKFIIKNADSKKVEDIKAHLKNQAEIIYGIPMKKLKALFSKYLAEFNYLEAEQIYCLIENLFLSRAFEKQVIACMLLEQSYYKFEPEKIILLIKDYILNDVIINWAIADQIATNIFSKLDDKSFLNEFSKSSNYLLRRCSVATFAEMQLTNKDMDMLINILKRLKNEEKEYVMRAAGWACRNILNYNEIKYFKFLKEYSHIISRIMLRCAIETLDAETRKDILTSSKEKRDNTKKTGL